jgi:hypothetical protein
MTELEQRTALGQLLFMTRTMSLDVLGRKLAEEQGRSIHYMKQTLAAIIRQRKVRVPEEWYPSVEKLFTERVRLG